MESSEREEGSACAEGRVGELGEPISTPAAGGGTCGSTTTDDDATVARGLAAAARLAAPVSAPCVDVIAKMFLMASIASLLEERFHC